MRNPARPQQPEAPAAEDLVDFAAALELTDVVFDLDGTLVALEMPWQRWTNEIVQFVPEPDREDLRTLMNTPGAAWGTRLNEFIVSGHVNVADVLRVSIEFEREHLRYRPNRSILSAIHKLSTAGIALHLWTSNVESTATRVLTELSATSYFTTIVARDHVVLSKPDPEGWYRMGADVRSTMIVGDSSNDRLAAEALGVAYYEVGYFQGLPDKPPTATSAKGKHS